MKLQFLFLLFIFSAQIGFSSAVFAEVLSTRVVDEAGLFSDKEKQGLVQILEKFRNERHIDLVVLTLPELGGKTIEAVAEERFRRYQIGSKGSDNGLLFVMSKRDRKMRLEVGYGIEASIPDITAQTILTDEVRPFFKNEKYFDGLQYLVARLGKGSLEIQGKAPKPRIEFVTRILPLGFSLLFFLMVYFLGFRPPLIAEKDKLNSIFGKNWPPEAIRYQSREVFMNRLRQILLVSYLLLTLGASALALISEDQWLVLGCLIGNFMAWFLFIVLLRACQFNCKWKKWYREYSNPVKKNIEKHLKSLGYRYSSDRQEFVRADLSGYSTSSNSDSYDNSSSSSSSPSDGGSSGGGGASSDW